MYDNAIVLTSCEWVDAASTGTIKVLDFPKSRKRRIKSLGPGSVILIACRKRDEGVVIAGEVIAENVKKMYYNEYRKYVRRGEVFNPQQLSPGEYVWAIIFKHFIKYPRQVYQKELDDIKTSTSSKPLSEWPIIGLTYIRGEDAYVIDAIRLRGGIIHYLVTQYMAFLQSIRK
jgi:hypothetical protein